MSYTIIDDDLPADAPAAQWEARVRKLETELALSPKNEGIAFALGYAREILKLRESEAEPNRAAA